VEAAFAGALGVRLGGVNVYEGETDDRGTLGDGSSPVAADLPRGVRLSRLVGAASLAVAVAMAIGGPRLMRRRRGSGD
jgi:adenosylcobinamide-phosphate synthase